MYKGERDYYPNLELRGLSDMYKLENGGAKSGTQIHGTPHLALSVTALLALLVVFLPLGSSTFKADHTSLVL